MTGISIILPTYNRAKFLETTLNILLGQFKDTSYNFEILIGDNNSKDNTSEIVKNSGKSVTYFKHTKNLGISGNINFLVKKARYEYLWFMGDDDIVVEDAIIKLVKRIKKHDPVLAILNTHNIISQDQRNHKYKIVRKDKLNIQSKGDIYAEDAVSEKLEKAFQWEYQLNMLSSVIIKKKEFLKLHEDTKSIIPQSNSYQFYFTVFKAAYVYGQILLISDCLLLHRKNNSHWSEDTIKWMIIQNNFFEIIENLKHIIPSKISDKYLKKISFVIVKRIYVNEKFYEIASTDTYSNMMKNYSNVNISGVIKLKHLEKSRKILGLKIFERILQYKKIIE